MFVENDGVKNLEEKLEKVKLDLEKSSEKMSKLENEMKEMHLKMSEKDLTVSKINKKYNTLKEKVTILFDMEPRLEIVEKKVEQVGLSRATLEFQVNVLIWIILDSKEKLFN